MKNLVKVIGILAVAALIGLSLASCFMGSGESTCVVKNDSTKTIRFSISNQPLGMEGVDTTTAPSTSKSVTWTASTYNYDLKVYYQREDGSFGTGNIQGGEDTQCRMTYPDKGKTYTYRVVDTESGISVSEVN